MRVVLSNGTAITVSNNKNPDLFWAMRGAGHNFGIVTEMKYKIYDLEPEKKWAYEFHFFGHDKVEQVFEMSNKLRETQSRKTVQWIYMLKLPFDPVHVLSSAVFL